MNALDLRQIDFLQHYLDRDSATYANALQSALRAGYAQEYAESITHAMPKWLSESIGNFGKISVDEIMEGIKRETTTAKAGDRLKAWELLGKSQRLFGNSSTLEIKGGKANQSELSNESEAIFNNLLSGKCWCGHVCPPKQAIDSWRDSTNTD